MLKPRLRHFTDPSNFIGSEKFAKFGLDFRRSPVSGAFISKWSNICEIQKERL